MRGTAVMARVANVEKVVNVPRIIADRNPTYLL
jgi:hypothetical protein